jgi:hypothetical protein
MSYNRPYIDELNKLLGIDRSVEQPPVSTVPKKCIHCCWGNITGDTLFCPFVRCEKYNQVFANALYGGSNNV